MSAETSGPSRRLTDAEETRAAELFAAKASDRQVAEVLGVGTATANRLRHRLADRIAELAGEPAPAATDPEQDDGQADDDAELAALQQMRETQAETVGGLREREQVSREAMAALDTEHAAGLAVGRSDPELRQRLQNAADDAADWAKGAGLAQVKLAAIDERIAAIMARRDLAATREQLAAAVAERDAVCARSGDRQRAAVLAVKDAAEEFVRTYSEEQAARLRVEQLAAAVAAGAASLGEPIPDIPPEVSTALVVPGNPMEGPAAALQLATYRAREGDVAATAAKLAAALGYLPPSPEELAAEWERMRQMLAAQQQPTPEQGEPWTRPDTATVDLDSQGQEIRHWPGWRSAAPHPLDAYPR